jgi:hypothetical protein
MENDMDLDSTLNASFFPSDSHLGDDDYDDSPDGEEDDFVSKLDRNRMLTERRRKIEERLELRRLRDVFGLDDDDLYC